MHAPRARRDVDTPLWTPRQPLRRRRACLEFQSLPIGGAALLDNLPVVVLGGCGLSRRVAGAGGTVKRTPAGGAKGAVPSGIR